MGRRPSLSPNDRTMAVGMLEAGQSARDVARRFGVSHSTILRLNERFQTTRSVKDMPGSGRPKKTTLAQDRYLRNLTLRTRVITARSLQGRFQRATVIRVSDQTVRNRLRAANICVHIDLPSERHSPTGTGEHVGICVDVTFAGTYVSGQPYVFLTSPDSM